MPNKPVAILTLASLLLAGCTTIKTTSPPRSATEQLLLSTATDHALQKTGLEIFAGRKVSLDTAYFDSFDSKYVVGTIRDALSRAGALVDDTPANSDIILQARSGALSIDDSESMFGIPSMALPIPLAGSVSTPEIAFYKSQAQRSVAKFALLAYGRQTTAHVYSSGPLDGKAYDKRSRIFFVQWHSTDVPELHSNPKKAEKYQTWFPQYDLTNMPATNGPTK